MIIRVVRAMRNGCIVRLLCSALIAYESIWHEDKFYQAVILVAVDHTKLGVLSGLKYGTYSTKPVYVCGFENALSVGQQTDFGDFMYPVLAYIEQYSTRKLVHCHIVLLFFVKKFLTGLVTVQEVPARVQLP